MITGEPLPVTRSVGDTVIGGTVNHDGALRVRVSKTGSQTALAQIIQLVETAQSSKPQVQKLADQIAAVFVPSVLIVALVTAISWFIVGTYLRHWEAAVVWARLAKAVCSVLIIACPCALGLAVPAALMVGTGRGARRGILIRDIDALQNAEKIDTVVLDKTGTLTRGKPLVQRILPQDGMVEDELLRLAAAAEQYSAHPLAKAIVAAAQSRELRLPQPQAFTNESGVGVTAQIDGRMIAVGAHRASSNTESDPSQTTATRVYISDRASQQLLGTIELSDELKRDSVEAVRALHSMGLRTMLLTGDNRATADAIAKQVGIDDVRAQVKPAEKAKVISELQQQLKNDDIEATNATLTRRELPKVAMVGDGINDAPALAQADLGIAIGSGSDIAKETGDIVLVGASLYGIATAIRLSRATMRTIRQNLFFAFVYNVLAIPLAAFGLLNPLIAAAAMALSDVTVIGNALLLNWSKIDE
jgi:Cu+-exporting ATPase